ncbi:MAG: hypothetical protein RLZZ196_3523 [Bacteroidota bacterium]|jgi:hypothetical protein
MLKNINKLIIEAKKSKLKPKYMVLNSNTSKLIPYQTNIVGDNIYKGLILQITNLCPDNMIYFHHFKPKFK